MPLDPTSANVIPAGDVTIPANVRADTPEQKEMFKAALEFERFFVQHMLQQMDAATKALKGDDGGDEGGFGGGTSAYEGMVTDQMTQAVLDGGGLGLASVLYDQVSARTSAAAPTSGVAPASGIVPTPSRGATPMGGAA